MSLFHGSSILNIIYINTSYNWGRSVEVLTYNDDHAWWSKLEGGAIKAAV